MLNPFHYTIQWLPLSLCLLNNIAGEKSFTSAKEEQNSPLIPAPNPNGVSTPYRYVAYWGQNSYGASHPNSPTEWEKPLNIYCEEETADIVVLSFLHVFNAGTNQPPEINLSYHCNTTFEEYPNLLSCPKIGQHIQKCQAKGKKVLLSLGGSAGSYGFKEAQHGTLFAKTLWNMFLGGESEFRPFGDAILDGVDLDIEGGSSVGYTEMIQGLRGLFDKHDKSFLVTGAPQCTFPDVYFGKVLDEAWFDYVFVQYYNNFCGVQNFNNPWAFNFAEWENWSEKKAINPNVKVLLGVPGSPSAANLGYVDLKTLYPIVKNISQTYKNFGGVMVWDVSQADGNQVGEHKFRFSEVVGSWLKSPGALGAPAAQTPPISPQPEEILDSEGRLDLKNLIETEEIPEEGTKCSKKVLACGEVGYMVCSEGKWKAKSCSLGGTCSAAGLETGSPCGFEESEEEEVTESELEEGEALYDIDMVPLPVNPASPVTSFSVRIRSKTVDPISLNWRISMPNPQNLHFLSTTLGAPKVSKKTLEIQSNYPDRANELGLVPTRPVDSYMSVKFVVNFIDKEWSQFKVEESKKQSRDAEIYTEAFKTIDTMLEKIQFVDLDRLSEGKEESSAQHQVEEIVQDVTNQEQEQSVKVEQEQPMIAAVNPPEAVPLESMVPSEQISQQPTEQAIEQAPSAQPQPQVPSESQIAMEATGMPINPSVSELLPQQSTVANPEMTGEQAILENGPTTVAPTIADGVKEFRMMDIPNLLDRNQRVWIPTE